MIRFEWDAAKAAGNLRKHGVSFETAARVFADPFVLMDQDRIESEEQRWQALGAVAFHIILLVAYSVGEIDEDGTSTEIIRIISARKADRKERQRYEDEIR